MLIVENGMVFQIDGDVALEMMKHDTISTHVKEMNARTEQIIYDMTNDPDVHILNQQHFSLCMRRIRNTDEKLVKITHLIYQKMFDLFKEGVLRSGGNMMHYVRSDLSIDEVPYHIHSEKGAAFNLDTGVMIECKDCADKAEYTLDFFDHVVKVQNKAYSDGLVTSNDLDLLMDKMPDMADGYPPMVVAIQTPQGTAVLGPKDTTPEFDEDLPMPTHVVKRTLN